MLQPLNGTLAIALTALCLVGVSACNQPTSKQEPQGSHSTNTGPAAQPVHPSVPGRNTPCPREGGLDNAGYPCEPNPSGTTSKGGKQ
jgi:hypothetical protein